MKTTRYVDIFLQVAVGFLGLTCAGISQGATPAAPLSQRQLLIQRGEYLARAGDCIACHTSLGGAPFAGGLPIKTPFGTIISTNITPDKEQGIGNYTQLDFSRALRKGKTPDRGYLYPAMPYASYSKLNDDDIGALYAYFMEGVAAKKQDNPVTRLSWPFSINRLMAIWNWLYLPTTPFVNTAKQSVQWNRGAYLVQGLGHCGACHTPRSVLGGERAFTEIDNKQFLSGATIDGWYAQPLTGKTHPGLRNWAVADIVRYLKTGRNDNTAAFGAMAQVVSLSTQYLTAEDLMAMATYLKSTDKSPTEVSPKVSQNNTTSADLKAGKATAPGALVFLNNCAACHRSDGRGAISVFPALSGSSVVVAADPTSLIRIVLQGSSMPHTADAPSELGMPGLGWRLSDNNIADVLTFIRTSWENDASFVAVDQVAKVRKSLN